MKTKLTLFIAVLAAALFGMGCASVPKGPPVPHAEKWNGHWYAVFIEPVTIEEARAQCKRLGGHLIIIETEEENKFAYEFGLKKNNNNNIGTWLGAHRDTSEPSARWIWDNGKRISELYQGFANANDVVHHVYDLNNNALYLACLGPAGDYQKGTQGGWWIGGGPKRKVSFICEWE